MLKKDVCIYNIKPVTSSVNLGADRFARMVCDESSRERRRIGNSGDRRVVLAPQRFTENGPEGLGSPMPGGYCNLRRG